MGSSLVGIFSVASEKQAFNTVKDQISHFPLCLFCILSKISKGYKDFLLCFFSKMCNVLSYTNTSIIQQWVFAYMSFELIFLPIKMILEHFGTIKKTIFFIKSLWHLWQKLSYHVYYGSSPEFQTNSLSYVSLINGTNHL